jgi:hypothetical protein
MCHGDDMRRLKRYKGIDAHVHIFPQRRLDGLSIWLGKVLAGHPSAGKKFEVDTLIQELGESESRYIFNLVYPMKACETDELNNFNYNLGKTYKTIIPFGSLHVENSDKKVIVEQCLKDYQFIGFKLHPYVQGFCVDDDRLFCAYETMNEFGALLNIHTGFDFIYPKKEKIVTLSAIENLIKRFPSIIFLIAHMFYPRLSEAVYLLDTYSNVYADMTNIFSAIIQDEERNIQRENEREILEEACKKWSSRMIFGSDHPVGMSDLNTIYSDFHSFGLNEDTVRDLAHRSAYALLKKSGFWRIQKE